ncbi:response regulator, partial [Escherichia coli]|nr:response regulator [Escherichia coli]
MNIPRALKVLLVEDEGPKQAHVVNFLGFLGEVSVNVARSVTSAMTCLEIETPDLLLLDMSLPTFDIGEGEAGGRPQGFGGIEVLRH